MALQTHLISYTSLLSMIDATLKDLAMIGMVQWVMFPFP
jgi:hypothetical protein